MIWSFIFAAVVIFGHQAWKRFDKKHSPPPEHRADVNRKFLWVFGVPVLLFLFLGMMQDAWSQTTNHTFRDANGRTMGRSSTDLRGNTTYYDSFGRNTGRSSTDSRGNTTIYNERGQQTGRISK